MFEGRDQQYPGEDTDAEQRDKADARGDAEIGAGDEQRHDSADNGRRYIEEDQSCVFEVAKHHEEQQKDEQQTNGHDFLQPFGGPLLVLEVSLPNHAVPFFQMYDLIDLLLCFGDGAAHVSAPDRELDGGVTPVLIPEDQAGARFRGDGGDLVHRHLRPALRGHQQVADVFLGRPELLGKADTDIEFPDAFIQLGDGLTPDRHFNDRVRIGGTYSIERHFALVEVDVQFRLADILDDTKVFDPVDLFKDPVDLV